jgi:hypothetical protein
MSLSSQYAAMNTARNSRSYCENEYSYSSSPFIAKPGLYYTARTIEDYKTARSFDLFYEALSLIPLMFLLFIIVPAIVKFLKSD